jgi:hypothetical protein
MKQSADTSTFTLRVKSLLKKSVTSAKRRGAWFAIDRRERGILSLAIRLEVRFTSLDLLRAITSALKKLEEYGNTLYARTQRGLRIAWAFSDLAVSAGNASAKEWRRDRNYIEYLGNNSRGVKGTGRF